MPRARAVRGVRSFVRAALDPDLARVRVVGAVEQPRELGAAGAEQAGEPDDLAGVDVEVERLDRCPCGPGRWPARTACVSARSATDRLGASSSSSSTSSERPIIFCTSSTRGSSAVRYSPTSAPLRSTVMRSLIAYTWSRKCETNRIATPRSRRARTTSNSRATSSASRLDVGSSRMSTRASTTIAREIATSCCTASECDGQRRLRVDVEVDASRRCSRAALRVRRQSTTPGPAHLVAEHDVLRDRQVVAEVDLLVHGADPGGLRLRGAGERALLAVDDDRPGVDRVHAGEGLDEGGLAGAVLAHQGVHLAGEQPEVDAVQRLDPGERDGDPGHRDDRAGRVLRGAGCCVGHRRPFVRAGLSGTGRAVLPGGDADGPRPGSRRRVAVSTAGRADCLRAAPGRTPRPR